MQGDDLGPQRVTVGFGLRFATVLTGISCDKGVHHFCEEGIKKPFSMQLTALKRAHKGTCLSILISRYNHSW
jgi:hypothetical protein